MFVLKGAVMPYILYIRALICFCVIFIIRSNPPPLPIILFIWLLITETEKGERATVNGKRDREHEKWEQSRELENRLPCGCPILSQLSMCKKLQFMNCIICFGVKENSEGVSFSLEEGIRFSGLFFSRGVLVFNCQDRHIIIY